MRPSLSREEQLGAYFRTLYAHWGAQHWWPGKTQFEVIVGAYLTQNTAWINVERALGNLRRAKVLSMKGIREVPLDGLELLIRPSGYFRQKARRLKTFVGFVDRNYGGSLKKMFAQPTSVLRDQFLSLNGVGPETADSILLYAGNLPVFVVDAYTRRILERHGIVSAKATYDEIRELFESALSKVVQDEESKPLEARSKMEFGPAGTAHRPSPMSTARRTALVQVYNEMHGLIVGVGKNYCRKSQARCDQCPLRIFLPDVH